MNESQTFKCQKDYSIRKKERIRNYFYSSNVKDKLKDKLDLSKGLRAFFCVK